MAKDEQRRNSGRSSSQSAHRCMVLSAKIIADLQVCVSSVELLEGMTLPAEAHLPLRRLSRALDDLVAAAAAAAAARRSGGSNEDSLSVGTGVQGR